MGTATKGNFIEENHKEEGCLSGETGRFTKESFMKESRKDLGLGKNPRV